MTTITNFAPTVLAPFQFQATLDGVIYTVIVTWNLFGRRWYVNVYAPDGSLKLSTALVGSPTGVTLQGLSWAAGMVTATAAAPHGYKVGKTVQLTVSGASPDAYNGKVQAFITGPSTFTYPVAADPGSATVFGAASYNIDLVGGHFVTSTMVFRQAANQFEVTP
jgi:hypothetical protein